MTFPDPRVQAEHLTHRFVSSGVPLADLQQISAEMTDWESWYPAWERSGDARMREAAEAERRGSRLTAAELRLVAAVEYHFGKFLFVHDREALRVGTQKSASAYHLAIDALPIPGRIVETTYQGHMLRGVLRTPTPGTPAPIAILVPGLDAAKEELHLLSDVFLRRGLATYVVDGPGQGESEFNLDLVADWETVAAAIVATLAALDEVDAARIGIAGVSLGGYFAARAASRAEGLLAGASLGGCYSMGEAWPNLTFLSRQAFKARTGATDMDAAYANTAPFTLERAPAKRGIPFLVLHGGRDRLFDTQQARRMAVHFGADVELVLEPEGNHVLHNLGYRTRPFAADWLTSRMGLTASKP
jgi:alpha-beta hydrolase superfamily lysophospholipase